ncbi:16S rRNA (cytosine(967)-C(5))-methyltransferase RsmB [Clostridium algidicarnis]|uniref:16S rRNA (cytosine(967)-C(5))-methyltransferase RsmB n=1 Tax=Clostridium algidicarnis TaxID=37659 RepID=UPI001627759C|nr:16S rRNA (cytosine(967)-C(5))-methyltransferase RsmB [Clostridium algidicarnis]MBB6696183.1 16S rRNA (cytosine(967)-C(5))-methyltransferase RsmB [Clostridium algidicarnis]MCB2285586.1 16S rRNA (cytosine(967)-C(5))-methyltransferase RsmB [Clostridium algidicarnis]
MNARELATNVLCKVFNENAYSNIALNKELKGKELKDMDRGLITEIVYGTIKYKYTIDIIIKSFVKDIKKVDNYVLNILRITVYQIRYLDKVPNYAAVNEAVNLAKKKSKASSKFVNAVLRNYLRNEEKDFLNNQDRFERWAYEYSFEPWMIRSLYKQYGNKYTELILKGLNNRPAVTVRTNSIKGSYDDIFKGLQEAGYEISRGYVCDDAIVISKGSSIEKNRAFVEGEITVQDESAMLVANVMDINKDDIVLDLCAAPGGKTTHIAELLKGTGKVLAFDIQEGKLKFIKENMDRLGLSNIVLDTMDATRFNEKLINKADKVLIDVPCSGIGIIRKKPEIKWNKNLKNLKELIAIQREIMKNASQYVKKGGILLYSTCTLNKEENEDNIKWFLKNNNNFKLEKVYFKEANNIIYSEEGSVTILPQENMDGFFIAKLMRV